MKWTTRFAPSPTGELHLGHAYAALVAYQLGNSCLLRFEDIDHTRVRAQFYQQIEDDLKWLGITWPTTPVRQSERLSLYRAALEKLKQQDLIYPCFCTRREINQDLSAPQGPEGPIYSGTCRHLDPSDIVDRIASNKDHCWRLNSTLASTHAGPLIFTEHTTGSVKVNPTLLGDVILARKDIDTSYHLAVVVDDADQDITLVTRGNDLLPSTHIHRVLQKLLDLHEPTYLHHQLINDEMGNRLAKRNDSLAIKTFREKGIHPSEVIKQLPLVPNFT